MLDDLVVHLDHHHSATEVLEAGRDRPLYCRELPSVVARALLTSVLRALCFMQEIAGPSEGSSPATLDQSSKAWVVTTITWLRLSPCPTIGASHMPQLHLLDQPRVEAHRIVVC